MSSYLVHWPMGVVCRARSASQRRQQLIDRLFAWKCCSRETFAHVRWWIAIKFGACVNAFEMRSVPRAMILTGECGMYLQVLFFELYELSSGNAMGFTIYGLFGFPSSASNLAWKTTSSPAGSTAVKCMKEEALNPSTQRAPSCVHGTQRCSQQHHYAPRDLIGMDARVCVPGSSPGQTHPRQAVRPGAHQVDLAAVVCCCRSRHRWRCRCSQ